MRTLTESVWVGLGLIVVGLVLGLISGLAEVIGLGDPTDRFGWKQVLGLAVGVALVAGGGITIWRARRRPSGSARPQ
jgi:hypothetical protein